MTRNKRGGAKKRKDTPEEVEIKRQDQLLAQIQARNEPQGPAAVTSYRSVIEALHPEHFAACQMEPHLDGAAVRMNELRGLILGQSSETETVLLGALGHVGVVVPDPQMAGQISKALNDYYKKHRESGRAAERDIIDVAVKVRNRIADEHIQIGSVWRDYATGGGELDPVISLMGGEAYDENDLLDDLDIQTEATRAAVRICAELEDWEAQVRALKLEND